MLTFDDISLTPGILIRYTFVTEDGNNGNNFYLVLGCHNGDVYYRVLQPEEPWRTAKVEKNFWISWFKDLRIRGLIDVFVPGKGELC